MFLLALGTFQIAASWADLKGISFFSHRVLGYIFGTVAIIGGFVWFFTFVKVGEGGPKGQHDDQALSTLFGVGSALLLTWVLPSIMKFKSLRQQQSNDDNPNGIEIFKKMTFLQAVLKRSNMKRIDI
jgi:hypothetical protein